MKVKSSALFGLMVVICSISGFSLLRRLTQEVDECRPSNLYSSTNITRRSTFSAVSSAPASYTEAVATIASGSESLFSHGGATLCAPAMSMPSASMSMGPSSGGGLYTTSSAELRSFGGGGNGGGVSMSGGSAKSSGPSMASAGLSVSMPSTSVFAYNTNRNNSVANDAMSSVSSDIAMASTQAYAGIGNTTGARGLSGRKAVPGIGDNEWTGWLESEWEGGSNDITFDMLKALYVRMTGDTDFSNEDLWNSFLAWFEGKQGDDTFGWHWAPISDAIPFVLLLCLVYAVVVYRRNKMAKKVKMRN